MGKAKRATHLVNLENDFKENTNRLNQQHARVDDLLNHHRHWINSASDK